MSIFEKATRQKLRFETQQGTLSVEDLWGLPLTSQTNKANLDQIARELFQKLKSGQDVSFVDTAKKTDATTQLKFDVVKYIIDVRLAENEAKNQASAKAEQRERLQEIIARKQDAALEGASLEDLQAQLAALS
jgi:hypothetical protein